MTGPNELLTEDEIIAEIRQVIHQRGDQGRLALEIGVSQPALSNLLRLRRRVGTRIAAAFGYRRIVRFERADR